MLGLLGSQEPFFFHWRAGLNGHLLERQRSMRTHRHTVAAVDSHGLQSLGRTGYGIALLRDDLGRALGRADTVSFTFTLVYHK